MIPLAVGDRTLNALERQRIAVGIYEALRRVKRRGLVEQTGEGWKAARWRVTVI